MKYKLLKFGFFALTTGLVSSALLSSCSAGGNIQKPTDTSRTLQSSEKVTESDSTDTRMPVPVTGDSELYTVKLGDLYLSIDTHTGLAVEAGNGKTKLKFDRILVDIGFDGKYEWDTAEYQTFEHFTATVLPNVQPNLEKFKDDYTVTDIYDTGDGFDITLSTESVIATYHYRLRDNYISLSVDLTSTKKSAKVVNGVAFDIRGVKAENAVYEYPGNLPYGKFEITSKRPYITNDTWFSGAATSFDSDSGAFNVLFIDDVEKWSTSAYRDNNSNTCVMNIAAVECYLDKDSYIEVGNWYLSFPEDDRYQDIQDIYQKLGYVSSGTGFDCGPIYCCHPAGASDTNYSLALDLNEYAERLDELADIGIGTLWVMPLFDTTQKMFTPDTMDNIYDGYGGNAAAKSFNEKAHSLGMKVIVHSVPHGPLPNTVLANTHPEWICKTRLGGNQIEWECLAFDYNNTDYLAYVKQQMKHMGSLGFDGSWIDCGMGGMANWDNRYGLRPSGSNLAGGIRMTEYVSAGFREAGKQQIVLPEMFYPIPNYIPYTDFYENNAFYRVLMDLNKGYLKSDMTHYVNVITEFLDVQHRTKPKGQIMMNWLENVDTVLWAGDCKRAEAMYGADMAKAMFCLISWIDGIPQLYMGDENLPAYGLQGSDFREFFKDIFKVREDYLKYDLETEYIYTDSPLMGFYRYDNSNRYLVLINLSEETAEYAVENAELLFAEDSVTLENGKVKIGAYGYTVLRCIDNK